MFILRDLLLPLQAPFSDSRLGRERAYWFVFTLLAVIVPFTSSMTSNLLRTLTTLFGLPLSRSAIDWPWTNGVPSMQKHNVQKRMIRLATGWPFTGDGGLNMSGRIS